LEEGVETYETRTRPVAPVPSEVPLELAKPVVETQVLRTGPVTPVPSEVPLELANPVVETHVSRTGPLTPVSSEVPLQFAYSAREIDRLIKLFGVHPDLSKLNELACDLATYIKQPLTLLVAGPFNCGKSTLVNCLLKQEILPSDVTPTTAVATILTYGSNSRLLVRYSSGKESELQMEDLNDLVSEDSERGSDLRKDLTEINLQLPVELLKHVTLVDSPGLHSLTTLHTQRTNSIHSDVDAVLWVTSCAQSASASEVEDIRRLSGRLQPMVVANQVDLLDDEDQRERVLDQMRIRLGMNSASLTGVSAKLALKGMIEDDKALVRQSCWPTFLDSFLSGFLPSRFAQRFSLAFGELLQLLHQTQKTLEQALAELEHRESVGEYEREELARREAHVKHIELGLEVWQRYDRYFPEILKPAYEKTGWLSTPIAECQTTFSYLTFPSDVRALPLKDAAVWSSTIQNMVNDLAKLRAEFPSQAERSREVEAIHKVQREREDSSTDCQRAFSEKNSIFQTFSFRYRKKLEEERIAIFESGRQVDKQLTSAKLEVQAYVDRVNSLRNTYVSFIDTGLSTLKRAHKTALREREKTQERLKEAEHQIGLQSWARPTYLEFESKISPDLLQAAVTDTASATEVFQPISS
jgi:GTPase SAR1 family protein